jgi:hypothetical protein
MGSTSARDTEIVRSYREGASLRELGRRYGITRDQARYVLVRAGVPRRPALKPTKADPATAWQRLVEGETARALAEEYGYAGTAPLYNMLRRHGYNPRSLRPVEHGSLSRYSYGCRCDDCRAAKSAYAREWYRKAREELRLASVPSAGIPAKRRHGLRATYNRGCRCDKCRAADSAYTAERKKRRREELRAT